MPAPLHGQITVSGSAQALSTALGPVQAFTIKAPASNANPVFLGASGVTTSTGHQLDPGDEIDYQLATQNGGARFELRPSDFYAVGTASDKVTWLASP